jgi:hypothetical protein
VKTGLRRAFGVEKAEARAGEGDRLESEDMGFHERVRQGYLDLAKKYPEYATDIINTQMFSGNLKNDFLDFYRITDSDMIPMYRFYHEKTQSVPNGRYTEFIEGGTVIFDSDLPYPEIPVYALHPGSIYASPFGYTVSFDMLPLQKAVFNSEKGYTFLSCGWKP